MKITFLALSMAALSVTAAQAGGPVVVAADPVIFAPAPVATYDWTGPYIGLGYGVTSGDIVFSNPATGPFDFENGNMTSLYAGYMFQQGAFVYGGELSYGDVSDSTVVGFPNAEIERVIDLKGRVGYAFDRFQVYGVLGYSTARYNEGSGDWDADGVSYGIGMEYGATQNVSIGLEYLARDLSGDNPDGLGQKADVNLDTVSLRVSFRF